MLNNRKLKVELIQHVIDRINDCEIEEFEELQFTCFNEDYYIIGYYQAKEWLKKHEIDSFDAIAKVIEWELDCMGEVNLKPEDINSEKIVNLLVYVLGEELLSDFDLEQSQEELLSDLNEALND